MIQHIIVNFHRPDQYKICVSKEEIESLYLFLVCNIRNSFYFSICMFSYLRIRQYYVFQLLPLNQRNTVRQQSW